MNATKAPEIRRRLLEERERILAEWEQHGGEAAPGSEWDLRDPEERATHATSATVDRKIADDDLNLLRKVDLALKRLEEGSYWHCANCGELIPLDRLLAKPAVSLCLACQEAKDAGIL
jgi:DnaK suppressor protein